jgi:hypothetical protein
MARKKNGVGVKVTKGAKAPKIKKVSGAAARAARVAVRNARRIAKIEHRQRERKGGHTDAMWDEPAPSHLVARLERPKSKYHSYFEFAENTEKKEKKLEFQVGRFLSIRFCSTAKSSHRLPMMLVLLQGLSLSQLEIQH